jgi:hypothetical protein
MKRMFCRPVSLPWLLLLCFCAVSSTQIVTAQPLKQTPPKVSYQELQAAKEFNALPEDQKIQRTMERLGFVVLSVQATNDWPGGYYVTVRSWMASKVDPVFAGKISRINGSSMIYFPGNTTPKILCARYTKVKGWYLLADINVIRNAVGLKWDDAFLKQHGVWITAFVK